MKKIEGIIAKLRKNLPLIGKKYKVERLEVFGSYVRGKQKRRSDVDILVEFYESVDLFTFVELEQFLSEVLGTKVDLVMKDALKPRIKDRILGEAISV